MDYYPRFKFDNIINSMILGYVLASVEGWPDIMGDYLKYDKLYGLFFVINLLFSAYFFMNLFVGVLFSNFTEAIIKEEKKGIHDNEEAQKYLDYLKQIDIVKPEYDFFKKEFSPIKLYFTNIISSSWFDNIIIIIILANMITIAIEFEGSSQYHTDTLKVFNYFFTSIFILECIIKLLALGYKKYFYIGWNKFDFFVVATSIIDIVISNAFNSKVSFIKSFQIIRVLRVLRVTR